MEEKLIKDAYRLRHEYFNAYEGKENKWHEKYVNHELYKVVVKSFDYDFKKIAAIMPQLLKEVIGEK